MIPAANSAKVKTPAIGRSASAAWAEVWISVTPCACSVAAVGEGVPGVRDGPVRSVVLQEDRGQVTAGLAAQPVPHQLEITHPLEHDDVGLLGPQPLGRHLPGRGRPVPGARAAQAVRPAVRRDRQQVVVLPLHERRRPGAVDVPDQDLHAIT